MHYQQERTSGCRISDSWAYRGLKTVVLENELVRVTVLADKGADIQSFVHKPTDTEFMWRTPWGVRNPSLMTPPTGHPGSVWLDLYEGGWQTVVPHGGYQDTVDGADMGLHGDVNLIPWDVQITADSPDRVAAHFKAKSVRTPFTVEKTLTLESGSAMLRLDEIVTNEGEERQDCVWLEHIAIGPPFLSDRCRLFVPDCKVLSHPDDVAPTSKLAPGHSGPWPNVPLKGSGTTDLSRVPAKDDRSLDMAYMTGMKEGWYALLNEETDVGWAVAYPVEVFKYLWFWRNFGGGLGYPWYGRCYNLGLEPCTSFHNGGLQQARDNGTARHFMAGESAHATIYAGPFTGSGTVRRVRPDGAVEIR
jgi:hypothetical protein